MLRLGCADTDEKLEACVGRFLTPVILKITSPHDTVRNKVGLFVNIQVVNINLEQIFFRL